MRELRSRLISSVVILIVMGFMGFHAHGQFRAHGRLAAGFVMGKIFVDRQPMNSREKQVAYALGWLAGIVVIASFALMLWHFPDRLPGQQP